MPYLSDYIREEQTKLDEEVGLFFAFSDKQWDEGVAKYGHLKPEGTKWASIGAGGYMPSVNVKKWSDAMDDIVKRGAEKDLAENGREGVLARELMNYEIGYSYEGIHDPNFRAGISAYDFTEEEIQKAYEKIMRETEW